MNKRVFVIGNGSAHYDSALIASMQSHEITVIEWLKLKGITDDLAFGYEVMGASTSDDLELLEWTVKAGGFLVVPLQSAAHDWCRQSAWDLWLAAPQVGSIFQDRRFCQKYAGG